MRRFLRAKTALQAFIHGSSGVTASSSTPGSAFANYFLQVGSFNESNRFPSAFIRAYYFCCTAVLYCISFRCHRSTVFTVDIFRVASAPVDTIYVRLFVMRALQARCGVGFVYDYAQVFPSYFFTRVQTNS